MTTSNAVITVTFIDAMSWKLKVLKSVIKFLNWATIPMAHRKQGEVVINVKIEISGEGA